MNTKIRYHKISQVKCINNDDSITFHKEDTGEKITIKNHEITDFAMAVLESYCIFGDQFQGKNISILTEVKEIN